MQLHKFSANKGATTIAADRLDENFAKLKPMLLDGPERQYVVTETPDGWRFELFPNLRLIEVERCDGKRMKVLGTGWYDP